MSQPRQTSTPPDRCLLVAAAPREVRAVLDALSATDRQTHAPWTLARINDRFDVLHTAVGKANAAGAVARYLDPSIHKRVFSVGIAGSLPDSGLVLGDVVGATRSTFADEGIATNSGFIPMSEAGFGAFPDATMHAQHDPRLYADLCGRLGIVATVSRCSGTDACARAVVDRTGALCEAMEGAAVALSARRIDPSIATAELRVISNTTGDRAAQQWAIDEALQRLCVVLGRLAASTA